MYVKFMLCLFSFYVDFFHCLQNTIYCVDYNFYLNLALYVK